MATTMPRGSSNAMTITMIVALLLLAFAGGYYYYQQKDKDTLFSFNVGGENISAEIERE